VLLCFRCLVLPLFLFKNKSLFLWGNIQYMYNFLLAQLSCYFCFRHRSKKSWESIGCIYARSVVDRCFTECCCYLLLLFSLSECGRLAFKLVNLSRTDGATIFDIGHVGFRNVIHHVVNVSACYFSQQRLLSLVDS